MGIEFLIQRRIALIRVKYCCNCRADLFHSITLEENIQTDRCLRCGCTSSLDYDKLRALIEQIKSRLENCQNEKTRCEDTTARREPTAKQEKIIEVVRRPRGMGPFCLVERGS